jgi:hypothetical protein
MLSLEQPPAAPAEPAFQPSAFRDERRPAPGLDYSATPNAPAPAQPSRDPFSAPLPEPAAPPPQSSGVGITRLIQMLDEPVKPPAASFEAPPPAAAPSSAPGAWTQMFGSLSSPDPAPAPKQPEWSAPPASPAAPPAFNAPAPYAAPPAQGPSEFTRILDASRMREMNLRGGAEAPMQPPTAPGFSPVLPPTPMPGFPAAPTPPMPHPGAFAPVPAAPRPQVAFTPPPMPAVQPPPVKPPEAPAGKLQQMVPLLLVVVIVLLLALIVTMFFVMKH